MSGQQWALVGWCAVVTAVIKAAGPVAFGGRDLPDRLAGVIALMAPALLAAFAAAQALADGAHIAIGADTAGVALAGVVLWRGGTILVAVAVAVAVTAGLRAVG